MADGSGGALAPDDRQAAPDSAWAAFDRAPAENETKSLLVGLLRHDGSVLQPNRRAAYLTLLTDQAIEPNGIAAAGWRLVLTTLGPAAQAADDATLARLAASLGRDELVLTLLRESPVTLAAAERLMSRLRRWLLLSAQWRGHGTLVAALQRQASLNGGAWPFDEIERTRLAESENAPMLAAYLPARPPQRRSVDADPVTRAVAEQYEGWPYPAWTRITRRKISRLPDDIRTIDPEAADALPVGANILVAGCGSGREAALIALGYPDASVTAIDISEASLDYARARCNDLGVANARFLRLDLHDVAQLGQRFHAIYCNGVLHHRPDPERGMRLLTDVLVPGGIINIMVYSLLQRMRIKWARSVIADLMRQPVSDDLLRQVRRHFLDRAGHPVADNLTRSPDFATLAGTHDLLLHRHEDPFDLSRLERALKNAGLRLLLFRLPSRAVKERYGAMFPDDPQQRDLKSLGRFERSKGGTIIGNYRVTCIKRKP